MARSDKVQFRREFSLSNEGYVGTSEGFFVGDIMSLHVSIIDGTPSHLLQGKVGRKGEWVNICSGDQTRHIPNIDIRQHEYVRLFISSISTEAIVTLFGYEAPVDKDVQAISIEEYHKNNILDQNDLLYSILDELKGIKLHLQCITDEEGI